MQELIFFIPGIPKAKQSARFRIARTKFGNQYVKSYQSKSVKENERSIKMIIREQLPENFVCHTGPVIVKYIIFKFDSFIEKYDKYRTLGDPDNMPHFFNERGRNTADT